MSGIFGTPLVRLLIQILPLHLFSPSRLSFPPGLPSYIDSQTRDLAEYALTAACRSGMNLQMNHYARFHSISDSNKKIQRME